MKFNNKSYKTNAIKTSVFSFSQYFVQIVITFVYRTVFLMFLSKEYLGINGLFANILQLFSLAELGIGSAITYSMYKPFAEKNIDKINALIRFYRNVYNVLAGIILVMGICFYPFIKYTVNISEVPSDVNLTVVYFLFVAQSVVSYLFIYKQSLLMADQQNHIISLFNMVLQIVGYAVKIVLLIITHKYEIVLLSDVLVNLVINFIFSLFISNKYKEIFKGKQKILKEEKTTIYKNTFALLCHKVGTIIVSATDNIILSKFVNLVSVGLYSNYSIICLSVTNLTSRLFSNLIPTVANYVLNKSKEESYDLFNRMVYLNQWIASFTTVCLYLLLNPFITLWLDESFLLSQFVVVWICLQHYIQATTLTTNVFLNGCGLFMRDKIRPLIESVLNIVISILLAIKLGIAGVFIGTVVSGVLTYYWRTPYLIFKHYFKFSSWDYWKTQIGWFLLTAIMCLIGQVTLQNISNGFLLFVVRVIIVLVAVNVIILVCTFKTKEFKYYLNVLKQKFIK